MRNPPNASSKSLLAARCAGAVLTLAAIGAILWLSRAARAEYAFRRLPPIAGNERVSLAGIAEYRDAMLRVRDLGPVDGEFHLRLSQLHAQLADHLPKGGAEETRARESALAELRFARRTLNSQDAIYYEADLEEKLGHSDRALELFKQCVTINPTSVPYNGRYLWLLKKRIQPYETGTPTIAAQLQQRLEAERRAFGEAAINWAVRAPHDPNAWFFLGDWYVMRIRHESTAYSLEAYRCFLQGLSHADWLNMDPERLVQPTGVAETIDKIQGLGYIHFYRDLH